MSRSEVDIRFGENLRALRKLHGMTALELADRLGITEDAIRKYERGDRSAGLKLAVKCAIALDCSIVSLIDGLDPRQEPLESGKELRMLSPRSSRVMRWVASDWQGDTDALITAFGYYAAVPGVYRRWAMLELMRRKDEAIRDGAITEDDIPECVREGVPHLERLLGGLYDDKKESPP